MRLVKYLTENTTEDVFDVIKKNCKPYLTLLKGKVPLCRGIKINKRTESKDDLSLFYGQKHVRKDRHPQGTPEEEFKILNKWLAKNKHARRDQSISVTADQERGDFFGSNSWIFPVGKFKYTWVKSKDFNHSNKFVNYYTTEYDLPIDEDYVTISDFLKAWDKGKPMDSRGLKKADLSRFITTNKGFEEAYKKDYEIWIDCKEYLYILHKTSHGEILDWKKLKRNLK